MGFIIDSIWRLCYHYIIETTHHRIRKATVMMKQAEIAAHAPDPRGRCRECSKRWRPGSAPCGVWRTAHEHLGLRRDRAPGAGRDVSPPCRGRRIGLTSGINSIELVASPNVVGSPPIHDGLSSRHVAGDPTSVRAPDRSKGHRPHKTSAHSSLPAPSADPWGVLPDNVSYLVTVAVDACDLQRYLAANLQRYLARCGVPRRVRYTVGREIENSSARSVIE